MGSDDVEEQGLLRQFPAHDFHSEGSEQCDNDTDGLVLQKSGRDSTAARLAGLLTTSFSRLRRRLRPRTLHFPIIKPQRQRSRLRRCLSLLGLLSYFLLGLIVIFGVFLPSYTDPPQSYVDLAERVARSDAPGRGNVNDERVLIAAALYDEDGELLSGAWASSVRTLIDVLGPQNVFLSIYENNPGDAAQQALRNFADTLQCNHSLVTEDLDLVEFPRVVTEAGTPRLKRIEYLADLRNRALRPLDDPASPASTVRFDKLLFLNDVIFDPADAANLLFSTNRDPDTGTSDYRAACAVDFINPFKFYDTFATRDSEGYEMGVPFYPWFTAAGTGESRRNVLDQEDAVPVKSCWSGMVSFEAKWFQPDMYTNHPDGNATAQPALRFRAEHDTYWDSSECCLIHADLSNLSPSPLPAGSSGIYLNPYVRVAYSPSVARWLAFTRRFERLYSPVHHLVNLVADRPGVNPRRTEQPGDEVVDTVWTWDEASRELLGNRTEGGAASAHSSSTAVIEHLHGGWAQVSRIATPGQFCGSRRLSYINEHPEHGARRWAYDRVPV